MTEFTLFISMNIVGTQLLQYSPCFSMIYNQLIVKAEVICLIDHWFTMAEEAMYLTPDEFTTCEPREVEATIKYRKHLWFIASSLTLTQHWVFVMNPIP